MARTIFSIIDDLSQGLSDLRSALSPLLTLGGGAAAPKAAAGPARRKRGRPAGRRAGAKAAAKAAPAKRARRGGASPKLKALRALQGRYMGAVRHLSPAQKAQVKKARAESGYEAALKLAASLGKQPQA